MPSIAHEILLQVLRERGALAELLRRAKGVDAGALAPSDPNLTDTRPTEWHGDALFLAGGRKRPKRWLLLEVQTSVDPQKLRTLPLSLELARDRYRAAVGDVVLVSVGPRVARWLDRHSFTYRGPLGTRRSFSPLRIDLARISPGRLLDPRRPSLSLLAVAAHARGPRRRARRVAIHALAVARKGGPEASLVADGILQLLDAGLRKELEEAMQRENPYRTPLFRKLFAKGLAKGKAQGVAKGEAKGRTEEARCALLRVIARRGFKLTAAARERIDSETDLARLEAWLDAAVDASSVAAVFRSS